MPEIPKPEYPHSQPSYATRKEIHLYSIAGWMETDFGGLVHSLYETTYRLQTETASFGGYFVKDPEDNSIRGELIDVYGQSTIEGTITEEALVFDKTYITSAGVEKDPPIAYQFAREGDIWEGNFTMGVHKGKSMCKTDLVHENAFNMIKGPLLYK